MKIPHSTEIGNTGSFFTSGYNQEEYSSSLTHNQWLGDAVTLGEIYEMRNDPQVHMMELAVKNPIKSATWDVAAASDNPNHIEQAVFIRNQLFDRLNWNQVLENLVQGVFFGCAVLEKVFKYDPMIGKIVVWKLAPRKLRTIERWLFRDGYLRELEQRAYADDTIQQVIIPASKCLIYSHQREGDDWLGRSVHRVARKPWYIKKNLQNIDLIAIERSQGIPVIKSTIPNPDARDVDNVKSALPKIAAHEQMWMYLPNGFDFSWIGMSEDSRIDPIERIIYCDVQITRATMADFLNLGTSGGAGQTSHGSYALSTNKSQLYLLALQTLARSIADLFNIGEPNVFPGLIRELVDMNWSGVTEYPKLTCSNLSAKDVLSIKVCAEVLKVLDDSSADDEDKNYFRRSMEIPEIKPKDSNRM